MYDDVPETELHVAVVINEITVDGPGHIPHFEESIVLVRAASPADAERVATAHAVANETSYLNEYGETVRWRFRELARVGVALVQDLRPDAVGAGVEVFSRFFDDLDAYRSADHDPDAARWSPDLLS